jgi:hypothetical protein
MGLFRTDGLRAPLQGKHSNASEQATTDLGGSLQLAVRGATGAGNYRCNHFNVHGVFGREWDFELKMGRLWRVIRRRQPESAGYRQPESANWTEWTETCWGNGRARCNGMTELGFSDFSD